MQAPCSVDAINHLGEHVRWDSRQTSTPFRSVFHGTPAVVARSGLQRELVRIECCFEHSYKPSICRRIQHFAIPECVSNALTIKVPAAAGPESLQVDPARFSCRISIVSLLPHAAGGIIIKSPKDEGNTPSRPLYGGGVLETRARSSAGDPEACRLVRLASHKLVPL